MRKTIFLFALLILAININGQYLTPPENLHLDGVPKIPAGMPAEVSKYTEFRTAGFIDWHPLKKEMLINTRFGDAGQIHIVRQPLGTRYQLTFSKEPVNSAMFDPVNGKYMLYLKDIGGSEYWQIFRFDMDTRKSTILTDGKSQNGGIVFSNKGDKFVYGSTKRNGNDRDFYLTDPYKPESEKLLMENQGGGWSVDDWSPDDSKLIMSEYISINESNLYIYDLKSGKKELITPKTDIKVAYNALKFDNTGKGIYLTLDKDFEFQRFAHMDLASGKIEYFTTDIKWDIASVSISKNRTLALLEANEEGISKFYLMDLKTKKRLPLPELPVGIIGSFGWHDNSEDFAFTFTSARQQADVFSVNIKTKQITRWTESESGELNTSDFPEAKLVKWKSFDGLEISGFLYEPPAKFTGKRPVIIDVHGGPEGQSFPSFLGRNNYYLNELGVAIIYPNVRGSTGFGKTFLTLDNGFLRENSYKDVASLTDWIRQQPNLDGDRIMVTGGSYGGILTLAVSAFFSDKITCALSVVGASSLVSFLENTAGYRRDLRRVEYGDERDPKMREYLLKIAPLHHAEQIKKPLFIVQGANDPRIPASEADQMVEKLKSIKTPVWYMLGKDEGHGFQKKVNRDYQFYSTIMFIKEHLIK